jgi:hypothetical protein
MEKYSLDNVDQTSVTAMGGYVWRAMLAEGFTSHQMTQFSILSMRGGFQNYKKICFDYIDILNKNL